MTRPDWCPEDVWASTDDVGEAVYGRHERGFVMWPLTDAETLRPAIARAILAEREACALVAEEEQRLRWDNALAAQNGSLKWGDPHEATLAQGHKAITAGTIARAIRTRSAP